STMLCIVVSCMHHLRCLFFFFASRRRHTRLVSDWSSDVCSSDLSHLGSKRQAVAACVPAPVTREPGAESSDALPVRIPLGPRPSLRRLRCGGLRRGLLRSGAPRCSPTSQLLWRRSH